MNNTTRLTTQKIKDRLKKVSPNIIILGSYVSCFDPLKCKCVKCNHVWYPKWANISQGSGCPKCSIGNKLTTLEIKNRLKEINPNIEIISPYKSNREKIKCKCLVCNNIWESYWEYLPYKKCRECIFGIALYEIKEKLKTINLNIKILSKEKKKYRFKDPLKCKCLVCNNIWVTSWLNLKYNRGCGKCHPVKRLSSKEIKVRLKRINPNIKITSKYKNANSLLTCKCLKCKNTWKVTWANLSQKHGCPNCAIYNPKYGLSEERTRKIIEILTKWKFPKAKPSFLKGLHLDGYNKKHKIAFEYQGEDHYMLTYRMKTKGQLRRKKLNDKRKRMACKRHGILLICVPYWKNAKEFIKMKLISSNIISHKIRLENSKTSAGSH